MLMLMEVDSLLVLLLMEVDSLLKAEELVLLLLLIEVEDVVLLVLLIEVEGNLAPLPRRRRGLGARRLGPAGSSSA